ncbi:MAG: hypothetical protein AB7O88_24410 [Reyranellaceae bacterium]
MRIVAILATVSMFCIALPAAAQGIGRGPAIGQFEIKADQPIPKTKTAVQLTNDSHLARELRRQVMVRLSQRGNEVGFSGDNVMRMDVGFSERFGSSELNERGFGGQPPDSAQSGTPRPALPERPVGRGDGLAPPASGATLRLSLTLYAVDTGRVLWTATASCSTQSSEAMAAGEAMINSIFNNADRSQIGDAGCP